MEKILKVAGALYDPMRLQIIAFLDRYGPSCVCELEVSLKAGQSRLSRHLRILKEAGIVSDSRRGKWVYYTLIRGDRLVEAAVSQLSAIILPEKIDACTTTKGCE
ncbi:MAG: metalloregulator ArsR/SmtB family transcription factor [Campylobacterales bacterium]